MPRNRSSNAAKNGTRGKAGEAIITESAISDITGVVFCVLAAAMALAIVVPQTAPVTQACAEGLAICFGVGALLVPAALLALGITFFIPTSAPLSGRMAIGVVAIVAAVLAMLSLAYPGAASDPSMLLGEDAASASGGWVGGAIAWALLMSVGQAVGYVILAGVIVAGLIISGFSISGLIVRARRAMAAKRAERAERVYARDGDTRKRSEREDASALRKTRKGDPEAGLATSFIGARKTSVLKRGRKGEREVAEEPLWEPSGYGSEVAEPNPLWATAAFDGTAALDIQSAPQLVEGPLAVPEFISAAAKPQTARMAAKASATKPLTRRAEKKAAAKTQPKERTRQDARALPPMSMLASNPNSAHSAAGKGELDDTACRLQATLAEFGLKSRVVGYTAGPLVTTFKVERAEGERVKRITNLEDDIALSLASDSVRIYAPIPGTSLVGIEIPNQTRQEVRLGDVLPEAKGGPLQMAIGRDVTGQPVVEDLASMPHLLIAGATGSGKSVMINSIIMSFLMRATPEELRLIMVDPKRVELSSYNELPHLYVPVVTEPKKAASALAWAVGEMDRRNRALQAMGVRNIGAYNEKVRKAQDAGDPSAPQLMPYFVIIVDELADLMMVAGKDVEASICRIAQLGRAAGIHLILATQRPSVDVVTGLIKANIESRIAFSVASSSNSVIILDEPGANRLLGKGDMLMRLTGKKPKRVLGAYVSDEEIEQVVGYIRERNATDYHDEVLSAPLSAKTPGAKGADEEFEDDRLWEAAQLVVSKKLGSTSMLQRALRVGYARAGSIMDMLEAKGIVGAATGSKPRDVLMTDEQLAELMSASGLSEEA